jgi:hypothetical protein
MQNEMEFKFGLSLHFILTFCYGRKSRRKNIPGIEIVSLVPDQECNLSEREVFITASKT